MTRVSSVLDLPPLTLLLAVSLMKKLLENILSRTSSQKYCFPWVFIATISRTCVLMKLIKLFDRFTHLDPSYSISSFNQFGNTTGSISPSIPKSRSMESLMNISGIALKYTTSIEEVRISPVVSRRGYLNFLEEKGTGWVKKFVVCSISFSLKEFNRNMFDFVKGRTTSICIYL
jgi:hypothetical protein